MKRRGRLTVTYERDDATGWWTARVTKEPAAITQGRTVKEARERIRKALWALWDDEAAANAVRLVDDVKLSASARAIVERSLAAIAARERVEREARTRVLRAVVFLRERGFSLQDTAGLLNVTRQYVHQLEAPREQRAKLKARRAS
jgi:predicted RNase H-like HicB family nuclease